MKRGESASARTGQQPIRASAVCFPPGAVSVRFVGECVYSAPGEHLKNILELRETEAEVYEQVPIKSFVFTGGHLMAVNSTLRRVLIA